jgi:hypothetical protein
MNAVLEPVILKNDLVSIKPFTNEDDFEYLLTLAQQYKYNKLSLQEARITLDKCGKFFWTGYIEDKVRAGVAYVCKYYTPNNTVMWTFDAYRDDELVKAYNRKIHYTYEAGKLLVPWILENITPMLWTAHDVRNRAATMVCKEIGFVEDKVTMSKFGKFIVMKAERR